MKEPVQSKNRFERHPVLTFFFLFAIGGGVLLFGAEFYFAKVDKYTLDLPRRHIILREHVPLSEYCEYWSRHGTEAPTAYVVKTDENGFLAPNYGQKKDSEIDIYFLGGSTTECLDLAGEQRFPFLAGRYLEQAVGRKTATFNGGRSCNNTIHSINILLNKIVPLKPDIVVMMHNINDLGQCMLEGGYWGPDGKSTIVSSEKISLYNLLKGVKDLLFPHLYLRIKCLTDMKKKVAFDPVEAFSTNKLYFAPQDFLEAFEGNLSIFISICRAKKIYPVLMTQANRFKEKPDKDILDYVSVRELQSGVTYEEYVGVYESFNMAVRRIGREEGVMVIDLEREIPKENEYMTDPVHLSEHGSELAAQIITSQLNDLVASWPP